MLPLIPEDARTLHHQLRPVHLRRTDILDLAIDVLDLFRLPQDILLEVPALLGKTAVAGYAPAGSRELIAEVEKCAKSDVILLQNHGVICCGESLVDAFALMDAVENAARTILYAQMLGDVKRFV